MPQSCSLPTRSKPISTTPPMTVSRPVRVYDNTAHRLLVEQHDPERRINATVVEKQSAEPAVQPVISPIVSIHESVDCPFTVTYPASVSTANDGAFRTTERRFIASPRYSDSVSLRAVPDTMNNIPNTITIFHLIRLIYLPSFIPCYNI